MAWNMLFEKMSHEIVMAKWIHIQTVSIFLSLFRSLSNTLSSQQGSLRGSVSIVAGRCFLSPSSSSRSGGVGWGEEEALYELSFTDPYILVIAPTLSLALNTFNTHMDTHAHTHTHEYAHRHHYPSPSHQRNVNHIDPLQIIILIPSNHPIVFKSAMHPCSPRRLPAHIIHFPKDFSSAAKEFIFGDENKSAWEGGKE